MSFATFLYLVDFEKDFNTTRNAGKYVMKRTGKTLHVLAVKPKTVER